MKNIPIGMKLIGGFLTLLALVCAGLGFIAYDRASKAALSQVQENIPLMAEDGARLVRSRLDSYLQAMEGIANREVIRSMVWAEQRQALERETARLGYLGMGIIGSDGQVRYPDGTTASLADRDYFKQAMAGKSVFSDVIISRVTNQPVMIIATPIKNDRGTVLGVLMARLDATLLSEITDNIKYGNTGYSYIIDSKGALIAHGNRQFVLDQRNFIEEARTDSQYAQLAAMFQRMTRGESGFDEYPFMGSDRFFGYAPIANTGWSIAVGAMKDDVFEQIYALRWAIGIASLVFFGLGIVIALLVSRTITSPINRLMNYAESVAAGDLQAKSGIDQKDEIGKLNMSIQSMVQSLIEKMKEADHQSELARQETQKAQIATQEAEEARRQAEMAKREGMLQAASSIEGVVERMTSASEELSAQVEEASRGAEEQKNRAGETATAMEEMNATVLEVAKNASHAAEGSDKARVKAQDGSQIVTEVVTAINQVETQTKTMKSSLSQLGQQAEQIGKIMNVIEDIADQTNLLALNAAIEAARAGDAGRGFAVVADEVRKLAEKTMNATKEVGDAISAIQEGTRNNIQGMEQAATAVGVATKLAHKSGEALLEIVSLVEEAADQVRSIATAAEEQSSASEEINRSVEDINRISTETSEVMDQSAQAISELAQQSVELQNLVQQLKQS
ncbi:methyl-accepting chemotaxis sensory transducer with Cache sensor [Desulfonatronum thiosulfatophilum]|uniref:Methyl-accepting chemotaxis sensory transducer with Cache sensor n=1 Tax=Desulfonatronum thiosulfatophilum TaxID=617002 RepID=A0A1G6BXV4_9BACT|nr:methyl-accepting chemotaxis protein [Desulfonatronum thiosulfatophilum]SDB25429.1 methyl-accepting chemotaxis sensory transducer with Cache sensor [Desulfonatronum thiosulfatophilum]